MSNVMSNKIALSFNIRKTANSKGTTMSLNRETSSLFKELIMISESPFEITELRPIFLAKLTALTAAIASTAATELGS